MRSISLKRQSSNSIQELIWCKYWRTRDNYSIKIRRIINDYCVQNKSIIWFLLIWIIEIIYASYNACTIFDALFLFGLAAGSICSIELFRAFSFSPKMAWMKVEWLIYMWSSKIHDSQGTHADGGDMDGLLILLSFHYFQSLPHYIFNISLKFFPTNYLYHKGFFFQI